MEDRETINDQSFTNSEITVSKWLFFFVFSYFFLYCNTGQFLTSIFFEWMYTLAVPPFASLFGEENLTRVEYTGSGDTPFEFYQMFLMIALAFVGSFFLLFFMKKEKSINIFTKTIYMLVRYYLIYLLLVYGLSKVFYLQFRFPNDFSFSKTLGDMSPMGLMWTFMGYSKGYTMFAGWMEVITGLFLLFRRTTVLGAMMTFGVMLNVFLMNMCYDVPVKLLSLHMTAMGLFLLFPVRKELFSFLFSRGEVVRQSIPFFDYGTSKVAMFWLKIGLALFMILRLSINHFGTYQKYNSTSIFSDKHDVIAYEIFQDTLQDARVEGEEWKSITMTGSTMLFVTQEDDKVRYFRSILDEDLQTLKIKRKSEKEYETLKYTKDSSGVYTLSGVISQDSVSIKIQKSENDYLLRTRGFHWMQDYPFNK